MKIIYRYDFDLTRTITDILGRQHTETTGTFASSEDTLTKQELLEGFNSGEYCEETRRVFKDFNFNNVISTEYSITNFRRV